MKTFIISDTHFSDKGSIIAYESRPFENGKAMDEVLIRLWNETVGEDDIVYHLGDVADEIPKEELKHIIDQLNGRKILVMGNHDRHFSVREWLEIGFDEVYPMPVVFNGYYMLSHEPLYVTTSAPYANIFGHVHKNPAYKDVSSRSFCVCVERNEYKPVEFAQISKSILEADSKEREELQ